MPLSSGGLIEMPEGTIGLAKSDQYILDVSFDILSLEALFLVPRYRQPHSTVTCRSRPPLT